MKSPAHHKERPAYSKALMWFLFSGTAMLSAFTLPVHFFALYEGIRPRIYFTFLGLPFLGRLYALILIICGLYHGLYRTKTIAFDLGMMRLQKILGIVLPLIFAGAVGASVWLLFFVL